MSVPPVVVAHVLPPVLTVVLSLVVGAMVWRTQSEVRGVRLYLAVVFVAGVLWQLQLVALVLTTDWALARALVISEKFTGFLASFLWVAFVAAYTDSDLHRRHWVQGVSALVVGGYAVLAVTNSAHNLLLTDVVRVETPFFHGSAVRGPVYFLFLAITYAFVLVGVFVLSKFIGRTSRENRIRTALLYTGAIGVGTANVASILGLGPVGTYQYGGYGAFPFIVVTTVGVFGMGLFDIAPVARTRLVETLSDAVVVLDNESRVVDYNREALSLWPGLDDNEAQPLTTACPELASQVTLPVPADQTSRITLTVDDETRYFSLRATPIEQRDTDSRIGHSLLLRDVTPLERSRRRLQAKNDRLDQVAATVSHDLRNPLQVADGYANVLASELDDPELVEYVDSISESHERMDEIIEDVLTLARQGDEMTEQEPLAFGTVVEAAWDNVETGEAALSIGSDGTVHADRTRLLTLLENLIRNSVEHASTDGGSTTGAAAPVTVTAELLPEGFTIADDGPGIPRDHADDVFEYGYTTSDGGTGLGLAIVRTVAHSHGWAVDLDDGHDGARFVFTGVETEPDA